MLGILAKAAYYQGNLFLQENLENAQLTTNLRCMVIGLNLLVGIVRMGN
jgi:hypothetical protein